MCTALTEWCGAWAPGWRGVASVGGKDVCSVNFPSLTPLLQALSCLVYLDDGCRPGRALRIKSRFFFVASEALHTRASACLSRPSQYKLPFTHRLSVSPVCRDGPCHRIFALASSSAWVVLPPGAPMTPASELSCKAPYLLGKNCLEHYSCYSPKLASLHHYNKKP